MEWSVSEHDAGHEYYTIQNDFDWWWVGCEMKMKIKRNNEEVKIRMQKIVKILVYRKTKMHVLLEWEYDIGNYFWMNEILQNLCESLLANVVSHSHG